MSSTAPEGRTVAYGPRGLDLPDGPFRLEVVAAPAPPAVPVDREGLRAALARPLACAPADEIFDGAKKVLIVVSDGTRATGAAEFLPVLVEIIRRASRAEVTLAVATGIHRKPTASEIATIVGPELAEQHEVVIHDPDDSRRLAEVGRTRAGTPVIVNAALREHDRVVLTGAAGFHYYAGFSGGRKALVPGLAGRETVTRNHLRALRPDGTRDFRARAGRLEGNPVHRDMAEGAALVAPHWIVNAVMAPGGGIERLFVGHWRRAHEAACRHVRRHRTVRLEPRDLVVASAGGHPYDINLIQAHKAFEAGFGALRPGGVFILVAACGEGGGHEDFLSAFRHRGEEAMVAELRREFRVYGQTALSWWRKTRACRLILVSELDPDVAEDLGAQPARDPEQAFDLASRYIAGGTRGWLLPHGARFLVEPAGDAAA